MFSIITVTLNNLESLKKTADSIGVQTCPDYEWIIIDGASADGTADFLKTTQARWISEPDNGLYDAMNKGIDRATRDYLLFLNAGDEFAAPDVLERLKTAIGTANPAFIYGDALEENPGDTPHYKPARPHQKFRQNMFTHHQAMLYNRAALGDLRYNPDYKIAADYDLTARFLLRLGAQTTTNASPPNISSAPPPDMYYVKLNKEGVTQKSDPNILRVPFPICLFESGGVSQTQAKAGRREQFHIRRKLALTPAPFNIIFYVIQNSLWTVRTQMPRLYWALKSRAINR